MYLRHQVLLAVVFGVAMRNLQVIKCRLGLAGQQARLGKEAMSLGGVKMCASLLHVAQPLLELRHAFGYPPEVAKRPTEGLLRKAEPLREAVPHREIHC